MPRPQTTLKPEDRPMRRRSLRLLLAALMLSPLVDGSASAKEYLLTSTKPNTLVMIDPAARKVARTYDIAGPGAVLGIVPSPDSRIVYAVTNHWGSVVGIDLDSGKEVFHADFSSGALRVRNTFGMEVSADGRELYVLLLPTEIGRNEYTVQEPHIAVYRTDAGLEAKPVRTLPVPRRTTTLLRSADGSKLYCVSWDIHVIDPKDGRELEVKKVTHLPRPGFAEPDVFGVWNQFEQAKVFINPYTVASAGGDSAAPGPMKNGMVTLDLASGEMRMKEFEDTTKVIFSAVVNPKKRDEAFAVYTTLAKIDLAGGALVKRIDLPHTYYTVNISGDGREVYVGGTMDDIGIYSSETLEKLGEVKLPGGGDQSLSWVRVINR